MSRIVNQPVDVRCNEQGEPIAVRLDRRERSLRVLGLLSHWREWIGCLDGEPERDVWLVELPVGVCEFHALRSPLSPETPARWLLHRWED